jgi:hypothetical protein
MNIKRNKVLKYLHIWDARKQKRSPVCTVDRNI